MTKDGETESLPLKEQKVTPKSDEGNGKDGARLPERTSKPESDEIVDRSHVAQDIQREQEDLDSLSEGQPEKTTETTRKPAKKPSVGTRRSPRNHSSSVNAVESETSKPPITVETVTVEDEDGETHTYVPPFKSNPTLREREQVDPDLSAEDTSPHVQVPRQPGEDNPNQIPLKLDPIDMETNNPTVTLKSPEEAIGRSFLMPPTANGERLRAKVTQLVGEYQDLKASDPALIKFRCLVNDKYEDIVSYNQIMDFIKGDDTWGRCLEVPGDS